VQLAGNVSDLKLGSCGLVVHGMPRNADVVLIASPDSEFEPPHGRFPEETARDRRR